METNEVQGEVLESSGMLHQEAAEKLPDSGWIEFPELITSLGWGG